MLFRSVVRSDAGNADFDQGLIRQVMLNLVGNAVAAMPGGGLVTLSSSRQATIWRLEVMDEGPGLAAEFLPRIFERFVQLPRPEGTASTGNGLGLAICRSIAQLHGGKLEAVNRTDRSGLRMILEIPA